MQTMSPTAQVFRLGNHFSTTALHPFLPEAMGKLQAWLAASLSTVQESCDPLTLFLLGHVFSEKTTLIELSFPSAFDYWIQFP